MRAKHPWPEGPDRLHEPETLDRVDGRPGQQATRDDRAARHGCQTHHGHVQGLGIDCLLVHARSPSTIAAGAGGRCGQAVRGLSDSLQARRGLNGGRSIRRPPPVAPSDALA